MRRRDLLVGVACAAAAGGGYYLEPRKHISLVGDAQLDDLIPRAFGDWLSRDVSDPVALNSPDSLAAQLYNQMVTRLYSNTATGQEVMMLLAYGAKQTDNLQLHRPEVCYPAFGYKLTRNEAYQMPLTNGVTLPVRRLAAEAADRREGIIYWARIGETLPQDGSEQRRDRLKMALEGLIPDGVLARFSASTIDAASAWPQVADFARQLVTAMRADKRQVLIGTARARAMAT